MRKTVEDIERFPPSNRHASLSASEIKRLVSTVKIGFNHTAHLEKTSYGWRLRVRVKTRGGIVHRSVALPDAETAEWVGEYIENARREAAKRRSRLESRGTLKRKPTVGEQP